MSNKENQPVKVVFRRYTNGQILALMPYEISNFSFMCSSYQHIGQHSAADYSHCISSTKPAKSEEYAILKRELENVGYVVQVLHRINADMLQQAIFEFNKRYK